MPVLLLMAVLVWQFLVVVPGWRRRAFAGGMGGAVGATGLARSGRARSPVGADVTPGKTVRGGTTGHRPAGVAGPGARVRAVRTARRGAGQSLNPRPLIRGPRAPLPRGQVSLKQGNTVLLRG